MVPKPYKFTGIWGGPWGPSGGGGAYPAISDVRSLRRRRARCDRCGAACGACCRTRSKTCMLLGGPNSSSSLKGSYKGLAHMGLAIYLGNAF